MARDNYMHFRASAELVERVDALAEQTNKSRSEILRALLHQALGDDASIAAIQQALYTFSGVQKRIVRRLTAELQERMPSIVAEETQTEP